jgi:hypothetical protein
MFHSVNLGTSRERITLVAALTILFVAATIVSIIMMSFSLGGKQGYLVAPITAEDLQK